ncbi:hypothetical protein OH491_16085 [Termitidicoccus mucosus]|uniref:chorismate transformation enzyme, FkbO/Hyg5 family n=1 Tax=Termitidicoccus mucosus TaxID=1184151 RepID=UPI0011AB800E
MPAPLLAGAALERIFPDARPAASAPARADGDFALFSHGDGDDLIGCARVPAGRDLADAAHRIYRRLFGHAAGLHLHRIWNYVPRINEPSPGNGEENYREFCRGRSLAFEQAFGRDFARALPAASAVGCEGAELALVFVAGKTAPRHVENPAQIPAYEYPADYGPRAPGFARATIVPDGAGGAGEARCVFISGTAAIKGHATVAPGRLVRQIECTLDNLRLISRACGAGDDLGAGGAPGRWRRHFKIYLRRAADLEEARLALHGTLLRADDVVTWLRADICRAALGIEIEATLIRARPAAKRRKGFA